MAYKSRFLNKGFVLYHLQVCKVRIYNTLITVSYLISAQLVTKVQYVVKKTTKLSKLAFWYALVLNVKILSEIF